MAQNDCQRCQRDISKPALVRCRDSACPLKATPELASPTRIVGVVIGGVVVVAALLYGVSGTMSPQSRPSTAAAPTRQVKAPTIVLYPASKRDGSWLDWLWKGKKPVAVTSDALVQPTDVPDPRAAGRVQSFPCDGQSSPGRALICTHWPLAIADYNVALLYQDALSRSADPRALARARRAWLARLDKQGVDAASILKLYEEWRAELAKPSG